MKRLQLIGSLWMIGALNLSFTLRAQPDLAPIQLTAPAEAVSERAISVTWTVENRGDGVASPNWYDQLYWSTNDTWEASDAVLSTRQSQAVAPGEQLRGERDGHGAHGHAGDLLPDRPGRLSGHSA
jgi:hypothetical protein